MTNLEKKFKDYRFKIDIPDREDFDSLNKITNLEKKFKDYKFKIDIPNRENFDPLNEVVEVTLITKTGKKYFANFITRKYENYLFEKNKRTGECAGGTYLWIPGRISVDKISPEVIKKTIDDLIRDLVIEKAFEKID